MMASGMSVSVCDECGQGDAEYHDLIVIYKVGMKQIYTVPSFPALTVSIREILYQFMDKEDQAVYCGFIRDCSSLTRAYPCIIKVCCGYSNSFFIEVDEFGRSGVHISGKKLFENKVYIIWKWSWQEYESSTNNSSEDECRSERESTDESDSTPNSEADDEDDELTDDVHTHTVVFKCIGAAKERRQQDVLSEASYKIGRGEVVEVRLRPEPNNPKDSRAIAFQCKVGANWERIGYVVREALNAVHSAIHAGSIVSVKFEWIRFITHWSRCAPGWYCGVAVTKYGDWPSEVVCCSSS